MTRRPACVAILGATATGKSDAAIAIARAIDGEVVSMDSRQVYRGLEIGTAQVRPEARCGVTHHLMGHVDPSLAWSAGSHSRAAHAIIDDICRRGRVPVLAGGTGLYFRALFDGIVDVHIPAAEQRAMRARLADEPNAVLYARLCRRDAARAAHLAPNDRVRVVRALELIEWTGRPVTELFAREHGLMLDARVLRVVLTMPRAALRERIARRTRTLFTCGWVEEVRALLNSGLDETSPGMHSLGYREIAAVVRGQMDEDEALTRIIAATRRYAKRQETFFRSERGALWTDVTGSHSTDGLIRLARQWTTPNCMLT